MKKREEPAETTIIRSIEYDRTRAAAFSHNQDREQPCAAATRWHSFVWRAEELDLSGQRLPDTTARLRGTEDLSRGLGAQGGRGNR
jgi:hypothetical protein